MKKIWIIVLLGLMVLPINRLFACSNVLIYENGNAAVARTTDYPTNMGNILGLGFVGEANIANISAYLPNKLKIPAKWKNKYGYIGYSWQGTPVLTDGINSAGVYAGVLSLAHFTKYPTFNPRDARPCLGVLSAVDYILATSKNVADALQNLKKIQFVPDIVSVTNPKENKGHYFLVPTHVVIRDKTGNSAVIEWLAGKTVIYKNPGPVLTNDPTLSWQLRNAKQYDHLDIKFLPADWSPVSRFVRAYQLVRLAPTPITSENEALRVAMSVLQSVQAPLNVNDDPTIWESLSDLKNSIYYFLPLVYKDKDKKIIGFNPAISWKAYDLKKMLNKKKIPAGFVSALIKPISTNKIKKITILTETDTVAGQN